MDSGHMALSIYFNWMSSKWDSVLDSQPRQEKHMSVKEYYDQFCRWRNQLEAVNYIGDEDWYVDDFLCGLKIDIAERVLKFKWRPPRVSDAFGSAEIQEMFLSWKENPVLDDADEVFDKMSHPESEHCDELHVAEDVGNVKSDDLVVLIEAKSGKTLTPNADVKVLDVLPKPAFKGLISFTEELNSISTVKLSSLKAGIQHMNEDEESNPAEFKLVKAAYQLFDKMPQLSFVWPFEQLNRSKGSISLFDCIPRVFDPGSVKNEFSFLLFFPRIYIEFGKCEITRLIFDPGGHLVCYMGCSSLRPIGKINCALCDLWAHELASAASQLYMPDPCSRISSLHHTGYATRHSLEPRKRNGNAIMTVFYPGGILVCYNGCDQCHYTCKNDKIWSFHSISRNDGPEIWCFWGYFQHCVGTYLLNLSTVLVINMSRIEFSYNHCCKCMWHEKIFRSCIDHWLLIAVSSLIWRPCHGKIINYITSMEKYVSADDGMKPTEWPLQELLGQQKKQKAGQIFCTLLSKQSEKCGIRTRQWEASGPKF